MNSKSLAVLQFRSLGRGLSNMQMLFASKGIEILEMIRHLTGITLLVSGGEDDLRRILRELPHEDRIRVHLIPELDEKVLRAIYSLDHSPITSHLLVIESESAGDLVQQCQRAVVSGIAVVDCKLPRGAMTVGHLLLTESDEKKIERFRSVAERVPELQTTLVRDVHENFSKFFDVTPKS